MEADGRRSNNGSSKLLYHREVLAAFFNVLKLNFQYSTELVLSALSIPRESFSAAGKLHCFL